jgi:type II restriction/modification system DNA methylase subunit YeeA
MENALKQVQKFALSDSEPGKFRLLIRLDQKLILSVGCLTYRVCRSGNNFLVFEE